MKNTRKKLLVSSVAMLLVAVLALSTATFAWFTTNPTVNADGLSLKATASAGLQILSLSEKNLGEDFDTNTVIKAKAIKDENANNAIVTDPNGETLGTPVSIDRSANAVSFYTTQADNEWDEFKAAGAAITPETVNAVETLFLRTSLDNNKSVEVKSATVTIEPSEKEDAATKLYPAIRVSLVDGATNKVIGTWSPSGAENGYLTATAVQADNADTDDIVASGTAVAMSKSVTYVGTDAVRMYVWLDGEDPECFTQNVENLKELVKTINVKFSTVAVE